MGCGSSLEFTMDKEKVLSSQFASSTPICWNIPGNTFTIVRDKTRKKEKIGLVQDHLGNVLLEIAERTKLKGFNPIGFTEPSTGKTALLLCNLQFGNFWTKKPTIFALYTEDNLNGGDRETTPTGQSMYRFGTIMLPISRKGGCDYYAGKSETVSLRAKISNMTGTKISIMTSDGVSPGAVIENMSYPLHLYGTCTFAPGIDPLVSFFIAVVCVCMNTGGAASSGAVFV